ncbi:hypothetical protein [Yinghuangia sp. YIM S10712]|uniref:hypothetical protein n=1 Tax=Yinghuangia sp. YIM S10712 TaxID=3436930 RepID=UPI003F536300
MRNTQGQGFRAFTVTFFVRLLARFDAGSRYGRTSAADTHSHAIEATDATAAPGSLPRNRSFNRADSAARWLTTPADRLAGRDPAAKPVMAKIDIQLRRE